LKEFYKQFLKKVEVNASLRKAEGLGVTTYSNLSTSVLELFAKILQILSTYNLTLAVTNQL